MITYKEFINKMIEKGYHLRKDSPCVIDNKNDIINTYFVNKGDTSRIIELCCPDNQIISLCGTGHIGGCDNKYWCNIKCYNVDNNEPFQKMHHSTVLTETDHVVGEIIVTKILKKEAPKENKKIKEWSERIGPILKLIKSENNLEHVMFAGAYPIFSEEFVKSSFTLYGGQKMTFYINNPDVNITKVDFEIKVDIFEKLT